MNCSLLTTTEQLRFTESGLFKNSVRFKQGELQFPNNHTLQHKFGEQTASLLTTIVRCKLSELHVS